MIRCERCRRRLLAEGAEHRCETLEERAARYADLARRRAERAGPPKRVEVGDDAWSEREDLA